MSRSPRSTTTSTTSTNNNRRRRPCRRRRLGYRTLFLVSCVFVLLSYPLLVSGFNVVVNVPPKQEECFVLVMNKLAMVSGAYELVDDIGNRMNQVSIVIMDTSSQRILYKSPRRAERGHFRVSLDPLQRVEVCIQNVNRIPYGQRRIPKPQQDAIKPPKNNNDNDNNDNDEEEEEEDTKDTNYSVARLVGISYEVQLRNEIVELQDHSSQLTSKAQDLSLRLKNLVHHQDYMRFREANHRELVETTFTKLSFWIVVEALAVLLVAYGQVLYLKRVLDKRRYV